MPSKGASMKLDAGRNVAGPDSLHGPLRITYGAAEFGNIQPKPGCDYGEGLLLHQGEVPAAAALQ